MIFCLVLSWSHDLGIVLGLIKIFILTRIMYSFSLLYFVFTFDHRYIIYLNLPMFVLYCSKPGP